MDDEWETEYNKLYVSPLDGVDEVLALGTFLMEKGNNYLQFVPTSLQERLSQAIIKIKGQS